MSATQRPWRQALTIMRHATPAAWLRASLIAVALVALLLGVLIRALAPTPIAAESLVGKPAPAFTLPAYSGAATHLISLDSLRGRPVLLVYFFTLCVHCQRQLQAVHTAAAPFAARGRVAEIALNAPAENASVLQGYTPRLGFTPTILLDSDAATAARYGVALYPTTLLLDDQGIVRRIWTGETSAADLTAALRQVAGP